MGSSTHRQSRRRRIKKRYAQSIQDMLNLTEFLREINTDIPIKYYKDQWHNNMIRSGVWDVFSITDPGKQKKKHNLLLHQYWFPLECIKWHVKSLYKVSKVDQYVAQNLPWSGVYSEEIFQMILFRKQCNWCNWQKLDLRSM